MDDLILVMGVLFIVCFLIGSIVFAIYTVASRVELIYKTWMLARETGLPEWKAWRLSAIEPILTTILLLPYWYMLSKSYPYGVNELEAALGFGSFSLTTFVWFFFMWRIVHISEKHQRGRLAATMILVRQALITLATFLVIPLWTVMLAFAIQILFGLYQSHVTPSMRQIDEMIASTMTTMLPDSAWDEDVLIKRLKGEGVTAEPSPDQASAIADPLVTEKNITVGRARELL